MNDSETNSPEPTREARDAAALSILRMMDSPEVAHVDVRVFVDASSYETEAEVLDAIADALQNHPALAAMISAYQLKNDGFDNLTPDLDGPIA